MYERFIEHRVEEALSDTPIVLIVGPRRAGKTTLVRKMEGEDRRYITLDDQTVLAAAQSDPAGFVRGLDKAIIDEIQRAPDLLLAIKKTVDEDYRSRRFLLTGSANVLTLPRVADSLAGRMETIRMLPLARVEVEGGPRLSCPGYSKANCRVIGKRSSETTFCGWFCSAVFPRQSPAKARGDDRTGRGPI